VELRREVPGVEVSLIPASGGIFDVIADGELVFSKKERGRHASPGEVLGLIQSRGK
jgi:selT/selW/selH-like putative selenoprotein